MRTASLIWKSIKQCLHDGIPVNIASKRKGRVARKKKAVDLSAIEKIPLRQRRTLRSLSSASNVPREKLHRCVNDGTLRPHNSTLKPSLTQENVTSRMSFCLSHLPSVISDGKSTFNDKLEMIHDDEKWFYLSQKCSRFYLTQNDEDPHRIIKNKNFITKVMFFAAVAWPRVDHTTGNISTASLASGH